jgi:hypothetical protein
VTPKLLRNCCRIGNISFFEVWGRTLAQEELDALLARMSAIANAVNAFKSEEVQKEAFSALVSAINGQQHPNHTASNAVPGVPLQAETAEPSPGPESLAERPKSSGRKKISSNKRSWKTVELNLRPDGKKSFEDFALEKLPSSNEDKYVMAIYYLEQILGMSGISVIHVATIFRLTKDWREPGDVQAGIKMAANRKGTINTSNYSDLKTTPQGRNFVEHDLPPTAAKKK